MRFRCLVTGSSRIPQTQTLSDEKVDDTNELQEDNPASASNSTDQINHLNKQNSVGLLSRIYQEHVSSKGLEDYDRVDEKRLSRYIQGFKHLKDPDARPTKSDILILALGDIGQEYAAEGFAGKADLTWSNPLAIASGQNPKDMPNLRTVKQCLARHLSGHIAESLAHLLALYIEYFSPYFNDSSPWEHTPATDELVKNLVRIFNHRNEYLLYSSGYNVKDLVTWTWVLTAETADKAAMRLTSYSRHVQRNTNVGAPLPEFIFSFLLRRQRFSSQSLRLLIGHCWDRLSINDVNSKVMNASMNDSNGTANCTLYPKMTEPSLILIFIRLVRHAQKIWPVALISITAMVTKHLNGRDTSSSMPEDLDNRSAARLTFVYNTILSLIAGPILQQPFKAVTYQQQAQFQVIRKMSEFKPALIIDREGYRAMTRIQLAYRKTRTERQWAKMKAKSWPPWKEEKSGLDVDIGTEHGISRARKISLLAQEAGYAAQGWEKIAGVSAGWDTDFSPTIQNRALFHKPASSRSKYDLNEDLENSFLWAGRIQSTRTMDEAWACFLSYTETKSKPFPVVYQSLFEKIVFHEKAQQLQDRASDWQSQTLNDEVTEKPLPGDGKEVWPNPGPSEAVYVRAPAPGRTEFYDLMVKNKFRPHGTFLNHLLNNTKSFIEGIQYLDLSPLPSSTIETLLSENASKDEHFKEIAHNVSNGLFSSIIRFLTQSALECIEPKNRTFYATTSRKTSPLNQAFRLVDFRKPSSLPPWYSLFRALVNPRLVLDTGSKDYDGNLQSVVKWEVMLSLHKAMAMNRMHIDFEGFKLLCIGLEKAIIASQRIFSTGEGVISSSDVYKTMYRDKARLRLKQNDSIQTQLESTLSEGTSLLKRHFNRLVNPNLFKEERNHDDAPSGTMNESLILETQFNPTTMLPRVHEMCHSGHLHAFIRVLGASRDYAGILKLLRWMGEHEPEMKSMVDESFNGATLVRRCVLAVGAYMERGSFYLYDRYEGQCNGGASVEILEEAFDIVEKHPEWGRWPTDEEMDHYCRVSYHSRGKFWIDVDQSS